MSFQYGSDSIDIPNPFKREGLLSLASGLVWTVLGAVSVLMLRSRILDSGSAAGWVSRSSVCCFLGSVVRYLVNGLLKIFRSMWEGAYRQAWQKTLHPANRLR